MQSMEIKTNGKVSLTTTLLVHSIQFLPSITWGGKDGKGLKVENSGQRFQAWT